MTARLGWGILEFNQGRNLHAEFVRLLPSPPRPIRIQRWSARRVGLLAGMLIGLGGAAMLGAISVVSAVAIMCLELFVAFLQAYIFTFLATLFIASAVAPEH